MDINEAIEIAAKMRGWTAYYGAAHTADQKPVLYFGRDFQETVAGVVGADHGAAVHHYQAYLDQLETVHDLQTQIGSFAKAIERYEGLKDTHTEYAKGYENLVGQRDVLQERLLQEQEALEGLKPPSEKTREQEAISTLREEGVIRVHGGTIGHTMTGFGYREYTMDPRLVKAIRQENRFADPYEAVKQSYRGGGLVNGM
jgi:hypothetical protein